MKEEKNASREGGVTPSNPSYGEIGNVDITPNKIEHPDDRLDPALVQSQLSQNPLRHEGKDADTSTLNKGDIEKEISGVPVY